LLFFFPSSSLRIIFSSFLSFLLSFSSSASFFLPFLFSPWFSICLFFFSFVPHFVLVLSFFSFSFTFFPLAGLTLVLKSEFLSYSFISPFIFFSVFSFYFPSHFQAHSLFIYLFPSSLTFNRVLSFLPFFFYSLFFVYF
jgi:hypothetical protein